MEELAEKASFFGNHSILDILKTFATHLKLQLTSMMIDAIKSDSFQAVEILNTLMIQNQVPITHNIVDLAKNRKILKIVKAFNTGEYDIEQIKDEAMLRIRESTLITGKH